MLDNGGANDYIVIALKPPQSSKKTACYTLKNVSLISQSAKWRFSRIHLERGFKYELFPFTIRRTERDSREVA